MIILINNYKKKDIDARNVAFIRNFLKELSRISFNNVMSMPRLNIRESTSIKDE